VLDLKALKVLLTVADLASMTAAAKRLDLSQSAVSQAIRQLEDHFGVVLVDRERRPLALTAAGAGLRERGARLVAEAETLYKAIREQSGNEAQLLRIGMGDSFAATLGPALLKMTAWSPWWPRASAGR
jgi:molybdate transport repressor ModE-like protein